MNWDGDSKQHSYSGDRWHPKTSGISLFFHLWHLGCSIYEIPNAKFEKISNVSFQGFLLHVQSKKQESKHMPKHTSSNFQAYWATWPAYRGGPTNPWFLHANGAPWDLPMSSRCPYDANECLPARPGVKDLLLAPWLEDWSLSENGDTLKWPFWYGKMDDLPSQVIWGIWGTIFSNKHLSCGLLQQHIYRIW